MYKYFVSDEPLDGASGRMELVSNQVSLPVHAQGDIVPLYSEDGRFLSMFVFFI